MRDGDDRVCCVRDLIIATTGGLMSIHKVWNWTDDKQMLSATLMVIKMDDSPL